MRPFVLWMWRRQIKIHLFHLFWWISALCGSNVTETPWFPLRIPGSRCMCAKQISRFGTFPPFITFPQLTSSVRLGFHPNFFNIENWEGQSGYKARFSFEIKKIVVFNQRHMHHTLKAQRIHVMLFRKSSSSLGNSYTIQEYNTSTR